ncbi:MULTISPECIES: pilus assembly protein PilM [Paenibacillus]|uniref:pilus assembly protein PilM n=1 Tax=Paenibacillus TaxID=44249 RepID=UPI0022B8919D|nr:pilus assembly protein PilM [Paenibacillus caseinilyticus]MCZ8519777.1 pilus assembly protein PilM [Paenibacillus caseinilyticus]
MLRFGNKQVGISVDTSGLRYIQVKKNKVADAAGSKGMLTLPPGTIVEDQIVDDVLLGREVKAWVEREGLKGASAILSVPTSQIIIRKMRIESTKAAELRGLVELEVETALRLPFEDPVYDYIPVESDEESTTVLVYAASRKLIDSYVTMLEEAGVKVKDAEISAFALARGIQAHQFEKLEETMLISLDEGQLEIYLFHNGNPVFMRTISLQDPYAVADPFAASGTEGHAGLSQDQIVEITAELSRILSFYQYSIREGASRIVDIIVTGSGEGRVQLFEGLKMALTEISVRTFDFKVFADKPDEVTVEGLNPYRIGIGLSLQEKSTKRINLLPGSKKDSRKAMRIALTGALLLVWAAGAGGVTYFYLDNQKQIAADLDTIHELNAKQAAVQLQLKKLADTGSNPAVAVEAIGAAKIDVAKTISLVNGAIPPGGLIYSLAYKGEQKLNITVDFKSMDDASVYLGKLRELPFGAASFMQSITAVSYSEELPVPPRPVTAPPADPTAAAEGQTGVQMPAAPPQKKIVNVTYRAIYTIAQEAEESQGQKGEGASAKQNK